MTEFEKIALEKIGKAIKLIIDERVINIRELSRKSEVSPTIIYNIINGKDYQMTSFIKVCRILQVHFEMSLLSEENNIYTMGGQKPSQNWSFVELQNGQL